MKKIINIKSLLVLFAIFLVTMIVNVVAEENEIKIDPVYPTNTPNRVENDYYEVLEEGWSSLKDDDSTESISFGQQYFTFINNRRYNYHIKIRVKDNTKKYTLNLKSSSTCQVQIDKKTDNDTITFDALYYTGDAEDLIISTVKINNFPSPKIGLKATKPTIYSTPAIFIDQKWIEEETGEELTSNMEFKQDRSYYYRATIRTLRGYTYKDNLSVLIDNVNSNHNAISGSAKIQTNDDNTEISYEVKFRVRKRNQDGKIIYESINCNIPKDILIVGNSGNSSGRQLYAKEFLSINTNLYDELGNYVSNNMIMTNQKYKLIINVHNGYPFDYAYADDFTVNFTGIEDSPYYVSHSEFVKVDDDNYQLYINYDTTVDNNKIYQADINEAGRPVVGKKADNKLWIDYVDDQESINYVVTYYNLTDNKEMTINDKFEYDKEYRANIKLTPKEGYQFARGFFVISDNQGENVIKYYKRNELVISNESLYEENYYFSTMKDNDSMIYGPIEVEIEKPVIGKKIPHLTNTDNEKYTLEDFWYDNNLNEMDENAIFRDGVEYEYRVKITPKKGYKIYDENNIWWKIPNLNIDEIHNSFSTFYYKIALNEISGIYLDGDILPIIGKTASYYESQITGEIGLEASKYNVEQHWYHNDELMGENETFEEDETYTYKGVFTAKDGYKFTDYTNVPSKPENDDYYIDGSIEKSITKVEMTYTFKMSKKEGIVYDYKPFTLPDLKIGKKFPTITEVDPRISIEQKWFEVDSKGRPTDEIPTTAKVEKGKDYLLSITYKININISSRIPLVYELDPTNSYFVRTSYGATGEEGYTQMYLYSTKKEISNEPVEVSYTTHVQNIGWQDYVSNGAMAGTSGKSLRLEGLKVKLENQDYSGDIEYTTHVQNIGWQSYVKNDDMAGTSGQSLRLEAARIRLTGEMANHYDIYYRVHAQNVGWMGWAKNGEDSGTAGYAYRLEGIEIVLVEKGGEPPVRANQNTTDAFRDKNAVSRVSLNKTNISLEVGENAKLNATISPSNATTKTVTWTSSNEAKVTVDQNGNITAVAEGNVVITATSNNGKIATCNVNVLAVIPGVEYTTHVQNIGWQDYVKNGAMAGTSGQSLRLEGLKIRFRNKPAYTGDIEYTTHVQNIGWQSFVKNDEVAGTSGRSLRLEATRIRLTGQMAEHYDIYYRVHAQNVGWMGWAKNGEDSGTAGYSYRLEGIEIVLVEKGGQPPVRSNQNTNQAFIQK